MKLSGKPLEDVMALLLRIAGFEILERRSKKPSGEIDILACDDLTKQKVIVSCKRVGVPPPPRDLRELVASLVMEDIDRGIFSTTAHIRRGTFQNIVDIQRSQGRLLLLIDETLLNQLVKWAEVETSKEKIREFFRDQLNLTKIETVISLDPQFPVHPDLFQYFRPIENIVKQKKMGKLETGAVQVSVINARWDTRLTWQYFIAEISTRNEEDRGIFHEDCQCYLFEAKIRFSCPRCRSPVEGKIVGGFSLDIFHESHPTRCANDHRYYIVGTLKEIIEI